MVRIEGEIVIDRPVEEVFDFVADECNEPRYNPRMRRAEQITEGPIGAGTRFRVQTVSMGRPVDMVIEFTGYQRPRRLVETVHMASMELHGGLTFDPIPNGTRMRWSWELQPQGFKLMYPIVARMGRSQERRVWTGLKRLLEEQRPLLCPRRRPGGFRAVCQRGADGIGDSEQWFAFVLLEHRNHRRSRGTRPLARCHTRVPALASMVHDVE